MVSGELFEGARRPAGQRAHVLGDVIGVALEEQAERVGAFLAGEADAGMAGTRDVAAVDVAIASSPAPNAATRIMAALLGVCYELSVHYNNPGSGLFQRGCATPTESGAGSPGTVTLPDMRWAAVRGTAGERQLRNRIESCNAETRLLLAGTGRAACQLDRGRPRQGQARGLKTVQPFHTHRTPPTAKVPLD